jgi:hypothetical protein
MVIEILSECKQILRCRTKHLKAKFVSEVGGGGGNEVTGELQNFAMKLTSQTLSANSTGSQHHLSWPCGHLTLVTMLKASSTVLRKAKPCSNIFKERDLQ